MLSISVGVVLGLVAGFSRGWLDRIIMFITDLFLSFPFLLGALAMAPIITERFGQGNNLDRLAKAQLIALIVILTIFGWMGLTPTHPWAGAVACANASSSRRPR